MANQEHLDILTKGVEVWNAWRGSNSTVVPDLAGAKLCRDNLKFVNFRGAFLNDADLRAADLSGADLTS